MIEQQDVNINGVDYKITQFPATEGLAVKAELLRLCGDALSVAFVEGQDGNTEINFAAIVSAIVDNMDKVNIANLAKRLLSRVTKGAYGVDFDQEFAGNYAAMYMLIIEVIKLNYGDILKKLGIVGSTM